MITILNLSKNYGKKVLFQDICLTIHKGEKIGLIGPNGTGKSTLFSLILGETEPSSGDVQVNRNLRIGYLPQESSFHSEHTVLSELTEGDKTVVELKKEKEGDISLKVKEIPEGIGNGRAEAPRGEVFHFVQSDGSNSPVRHKIRAPSYVNIATFKKSCIGQTIADATISLAAVDPCYCCTERMAVAYDLTSGEKIMNAFELINESLKKTIELKRTIKGQL